MCDGCEARVRELIEVNLGITIEFKRCPRISAQTNSSKN